MFSQRINNLIRIRNERNRLTWLTYLAGRAGGVMGKGVQEPALCRLFDGRRGSHV